MMFWDTRYWLIPCHLSDTQLLSTSESETVNVVHRTQLFNNPTSLAASAIGRMQILMQGQKFLMKIRG